MDKLIISLTDSLSESEIENHGTKLSVSWAALMPALSEFVRLRPDEVISGLVIDNVAVSVAIDRKRGRKVSPIKSTYMNKHFKGPKEGTDETDEPEEVLGD